MISSLELSEPSALHIADQNSSHQTEWKRIVTDLTSLGGVFGSPPSSPLSISWSSSGSSIDNENHASSKAVAHHHIVTTLNFETCVPQNTAAPHHIRAKVTRSVINCSASPLDNQDACISEKCEHVEQTAAQNVAPIESQGILSITSPNVSPNVNTVQVNTETVDVQSHSEENESPAAPLVEIPSQLSPIIGTKKYAHSSCCKEAVNRGSHVTDKANTQSQYFSVSPLLGTLSNKKRLKTCSNNKQSRSAVSPIFDNSCASPILEHKRRRKLNFENSSRKSHANCPRQDLNFNLPVNDVSVKKDAELIADIPLQKHVEHCNSVSHAHPTESANSESQMNKPASPVLLPLKHQTRKRKRRRKIQMDKTSSNENVEQILLHLNQRDTNVELKKINNMGFQTPNKDKTRNALTDISGESVFNPSGNEKSTIENLKLKENLNKIGPFDTEEQTFPRKHVRRKTVQVKGIKELNNDHCSDVNSESMLVTKNQIISPKTGVCFSSGEEVTNIRESKRFTNLAKAIPEKITLLKNVTDDTMHVEPKSVGESILAGVVVESVISKTMETPEKVKNSTPLVANKSTRLLQQSNEVNLVADKQVINDELAPYAAINTAGCEDLPTSPTLRTARDLCNIKQKKMRHKQQRLPLFEVKGCIRQQVSAPKPYKLSDLEETLIKLSFPKPPVSDLAITSATRHKERLNWLREQRSKGIDQSYSIEHETQENLIQMKGVTASNFTNRCLEKAEKVIETYVDKSSVSVEQTRFGAHALDSSVSDRKCEQEAKCEGQKGSPVCANSFEVCTENESSQEVGSVKVCNKKEEEYVPSQEISEKSTSSGNTSPVAQDYISDCTTPNKTSASVSGEEIVPYCDSAKKKRRLRLTKNGLAERLQKLLSRQHSSTRMWQHELSRGNTHWKKSGVTLTVTCVKREYSHLLLQGLSCASNSSEEKKISEIGGNTVSAQLIVVLDPVCAPHLKVGSRIKIYPPWYTSYYSRKTLEFEKKFEMDDFDRQTLSITERDITLVLGVTCVEELSVQSKSKLASLKPIKEEVVYAVNCSCLSQEPDAQRKCQFHFPLGGTEIFNHLLPHVQAIKGSLYCNVKSEHQPWHGTITDIVARHGCLLTASVWLQLQICKVFHYVDRASKEDVWSLLGRDSIGECCEVILGSSTAEMHALNCWPDIATQHIIGHLYRFTGFTLTDRRHKSRHQDLWTVMKDVQLHLKQTTKGADSEHAALITGIQEEADKELEALKDIKSVKCVDSCAENKQITEENSQLFLYVLSPCAENWEIKCVAEEVVSERSNIRNVSLSDALQQIDDNLCRCSCLVKLLYAAPGNLYVTDTSLGEGTLPVYVTITVKPSCFLPAEVAGRKTKAVFLQDLLCNKGKLSVDKYSRVISLQGMGARISFLDFEESCKSEIMKLNVTFPKMDLDSSVGHLVTVSGAVIGIDEESAFAWPVCSRCENDLLLEVNANEYICQQCKKITETYQKMSLEVFISCSWIPLSSSIKVKLLQGSILKLLPSTGNKNEGYSLLTVLGQEVGPLTCRVASAGNHCFILDEIRTL